MAHILVTGGTGTLGSKIVPRLTAQGHMARIMSRSVSRLTPNSNNKLEWAQATLATGAGVAEAVRGIDTIVHCASSAFGETQAVDLDGTARMLQLAKAEGVAHVIYISITGIDNHPFSYYQNKLATEKIIQNGGIPWTILRTTQFHEFIDLIFTALDKVPLVLPVPTAFTIQPVDVGEVADHMVAAVNRAPAGWLPDVAGPEVLSVGEMAKVWQRARNSHKPMINLPWPGKVGAAFRSGMLTKPDRAVGQITWAQWIEQKYGVQAHKEQFA